MVTKHKTPKEEKEAAMAGTVKAETKVEATPVEIAGGLAGAKHPSKKKRVSKKSIIIISARRKMSVARITIKPGKNQVYVNKVSVSAISNPFVRDLILEPIKLAGDYASNIDIDVNVYGGGTMSQAQAVRTAIARGLVTLSKDPQLKQAMLSYDRFLLVEDPRQVEPKKYKGRKARARFQKSYR